MKFNELSYTELNDINGGIEPITICLIAFGLGLSFGGAIALVEKYGQTWATNYANKIKSSTPYQSYFGM